MAGAELGNINCDINNNNNKRNNYNCNNKTTSMGCETIEINLVLDYNEGEGRKSASDTLVFLGGGSDGAFSFTPVGMFHI